MASDPPESSRRSQIAEVVRGRWTAWASWVIGIAIVMVGIRSSLDVPAQADDMLKLFGIGGPDHRSMVGESWSAARAHTDTFLAGGDRHFYPFGLALDKSLKRAMLRADGWGTTANTVHHGVFLVTALATFVAATHLTARLRSAAPSRRAVATCAVPVALGFVAAAQVTTVWATYDPLVVHPIFGALATCVGFGYLAVLARVREGGAHMLSAVGCTVLGVFGVLLYEGFYVFVAAALMMVAQHAWVHRVPGSRWVDRLSAVPLAARSALLAPIAIILVSRTVSLFVAQSDYQGTAVSLRGRALVATVTSLQTTAPAGTWGRAERTVAAAGVDIARPSLLALFTLVGGAAWWTWSVRRGSDRDDELPAPNSPSVAWWPPIVVVIIGTSALFAATAQWGDLLVNSGVTYMGAAGAFWGWAIVLAVGLERVTHRARTHAVAALAVGALVCWSVVQLGLNAAVVRVETASPTPFAVDLVRMLDDGTSLSMDERCSLLDHVPQADQIDDWRGSLNRHYSGRHGVEFCAEP
ncbi:MAG: hypothetical protein Q8M22_01990 [Actinomycetota bacterium]|nr:hypothetical protein [Actinomycetota bacterium]